MDRQQFSEFFAQQGYRVYQTPSSYWVEAHPFCFQNIPYFQAINPTEEELHSLFFRKLAILVRFITSQDAKAMPAYYWVCADKGYDFHLLETKSRNQTRRGLENTRVSPLSFDFLVKKGMILIKDTAVRQEREPDFASPEEWATFCEVAGKIPDFDAWGAFVDNRLAAFLIGAKILDYYYILHQASETRSLNMRPNNALVYIVTKEKINDASINAVSYGLDSVEFTPGLNRFKSGMGYQREKIYQRIMINPWFRWIKNKQVMAALAKVIKITPQSNYLRKAHAVLNTLTQ